MFRRYVLIDNYDESIDKISLVFSKDVNSYLIYPQSSENVREQF